MTVNVKIQNGVRYGTYDIKNKKGSFPTQGITTKNLEQAKSLKFSSRDFKTNILEIIVDDPKELIFGSNYWKTCVSKVKELVKENNDKLCFIVLRGEKSMVISKSRNRELINFQLECGLEFVKVYFYHIESLESAIDNYKYYKNYKVKQFKNANIVPVLDEKLVVNTFTKLYMAFIDDRVEIIGFLGREPNMNDNIIRINMDFIASRGTDKILRLVSFIPKSYRGIIRPLAYTIHGFDAFSFRTNMTRQKRNKFIPLPKVHDNLKFKLLTPETDLKCVVTKLNLHESYKQNSYVVISIYDIVSINNEFEKLHINYTLIKLKEIVNSV